MVGWLCLLLIPLSEVFAHGLGCTLQGLHLAWARAIIRQLGLRKIAHGVLLPQTQHPTPSKWEQRPARDVLFPQTQYPTLCMWEQRPARDALFPHHRSPLLMNSSAPIKGLIQAAASGSTAKSAAFSSGFKSRPPPSFGMEPNTMGGTSHKGWRLLEIKTDGASNK